MIKRESPTPMSIKSISNHEADDDEAASIQVFEKQHERIYGDLAVDSRIPSNFIELPLQERVRIELNDQAIEANKE